MIYVIQFSIHQFSFQFTSPSLQNLVFQILAMAKMHAGNNEERFVLASLKEFVKTWGLGRAGSFQLVCDKGHAKLSMEFSLETPGSPHFTPSDGNQDTLKCDKRRKNPSTLRRDKKRSLSLSYCHYYHIVEAYWPTLVVLVSNG